VNISTTTNNRDSDPFTLFAAFYNRNGKKAGTYTRSDAKAKKWSFTPR
jgi:hypothetical protein